MAKLTDTQLIVLSSAAQRQDRAIVMPERLKGAAAARTVQVLVGKGLAAEVPAAGALPVHRRSEQDGPIALVITAAGLAAIGVEPDEAATPAQGAEAGSEPEMDQGATGSSGTTSRRTGSTSSRGRVAKTSLPTGLEAEQAAEHTAMSCAPAKAPADSVKEATSTPRVAHAASVEKPPRGGSKLVKVIELLERAEGATIDDLVAATGWLPHTTRAALTGLRKRGYAVTRERPEASSGSVYRIASVAGTQAA